MAKRAIAADELINSITEILFRAEGETIKEIAEMVGISGIEYEGDSIFSIEDN